MDAGRLFNVLRRPTRPGQPPHTWPQLGSRVEFTPDGKRLLYQLHEPLVNSLSMNLWDIEAGSTVMTLSSDFVQFNNVFALSPDGKTFAWGGNQREVINVTGIAGGEVLVLRGHRGPIIKMAFSPDGRRLATCSLDGALCVWSVEGNAEAQRFAGERSPE